MGTRLGAVRLSAAFVLTTALPSNVLAQNLLTQDFQAGLQSWTTSGGSGTHWHLAFDGQCGSVTNMAAFNQIATCAYPTTVAQNVSRLSSPIYDLWVSEYDTVHLLFDYRRQLDPGESSSVYLENKSYGGQFVLADDLPDTTDLRHVVLTLPNAEEWITINQQIHFQVTTDDQGNTGFGVQVDNIRLRRTWTVGGAGLGGIGPPPLLTGQGPLEPGSANALVLLAPEPFAPAWVVVGLEQGWAPFKGGVLVPTPDFVLPVQLPHSGELTIPFVLPAVPSDLKLFIQCWVLDPAASFGWAASNALVGVTA